MQQHGIEVIAGNGATSAAATNNGAAASTSSPRIAAPNSRLYTSAEAETIKKEICSVGRKLWMRQFVDGNGGNISYRMGPNEVLCTPTLVSKYDLTPDDLCMTDLNGVQIAGPKPRTSELLLHLEIYKAVPEAKAVVHCHPRMPRPMRYRPRPAQPYYSGVRGIRRQGRDFALRNAGNQGLCRDGSPLCEDAQYGAALKSWHCLLGGHGDARGVVRRSARDLLLDAANRFTARSADLADVLRNTDRNLLEIKKKLGLPDIRFDTSRMKECQLSDLEVPNSIALAPAPCDGPAPNRGAEIGGADMETLIKSVTDAVMGAIGGKVTAARGDRVCRKAHLARISKCRSDTTMKAAERQLRIRQMFEARDFVDTETLCRELDASESSIRRDLDILAEEGILKRVYGGAVSVQSPPHRSFDYAAESVRLSDEKSRIGRMTAGAH